MSGWNYEARAREVDEFHQAQFAQKVAERQTVAVSRPIPDGLSPAQIDLFQINAEDFDYTSKFVSHLPDFLSKYFVRRYSKTLKECGRTAANSWIRRTMQGSKQGSNNGNSGILKRVEGVMARYPQAVAVNLPRRDVITEKNGYTLRFKANKGLEEFIRSEVEDFARFVSSELFTLFGEFKEKYLNVVMEDEDHIERVMASLYLKMAYLTRQYGITPPSWEKHQAGKMSAAQRDVAMSKMLDEDWWFRVLWRLRNEMREHLCIAVGQVQKSASAYASRECVNMWREQKRKNTDYLKQMELINEDDEEERIDLSEMFYKTVSNPAVRRCELMVRMRGFEDLAERMGYVGEFYTLTAPSAYHACSSKGGFNGKWNFSSPKDTQRYLCNVWNKVRASLQRKGIKLFGFRVVEPHHDGTPHWHMLFFMLPEQVETVRATFLRYALEVDGSEAGASEHRFTAKAIEKEKGSATGYIAKYIAKNIDGYAMDDEVDDETGEKCKDLAKNVSAWASRWRIRQFQQVGGAPVTTWRELRRLKGKVFADDTALSSISTACDESKWDLYTELQGGAFVMRKDLVVRPAYEEREPNTYGEISKKVVGVVNQLKALSAVVCTRLKHWLLRKKSVHSDDVGVSIHCVRSTPWSSVNNCTEVKKQTIGKIDKICSENEAEHYKRLKNALILQGIPSRFISELMEKVLIRGGSVKLYGNTSIKFNGVEIVFD